MLIFYRPGKKNQKNLKRAVAPPLLPLVRLGVKDGVSLLLNKPYSFSSLSRREVPLVVIPSTFSHKVEEKRYLEIPLLIFVKGKPKEYV